MSQQLEALKELLESKMIRSPVFPMNVEEEILSEAVEELERLEKLIIEQMNQPRNVNSHQDLEGRRRRTI